MFAIRDELMQAECSMGIDVIPTHQALDMWVFSDLSNVIREFWNNDDGVCIAGNEILETKILRILSSGVEQACLELSVARTILVFFIDIFFF